MPAAKGILFTPGPVMTSDTVKAAMLTDYGSRDARFMSAIKFVRQNLLSLTDLDAKEWACVLQPGAGTMGVESAVTTFTPVNKGKYLLINSGKYSQRQRAMALREGIPFIEIVLTEGEDIPMDKLEALLRANPDVSVLGMVHHETSTGMVYPAEEVYALLKRVNPSATMILDCISSLGGIAFDIPKSCDVLIGSSNKCYHGLPGFSIIICRRSLLAKSKGNARASCLDLYEAFESQEKKGQFIVTPPVQSIMAFQQALIEYKQEGGMPERIKSYAAKARIVRESARKMGFNLFLHESRPCAANIVISIDMPKDPKWSFQKFYQYLNQRNFIIYPGKASKHDAFRIGIIGHTSEEDMRNLMACCQEALLSMGIKHVGPSSNL